MGRDPVAVGESDSVVPKAVVIPTTMPEVGSDGRGMSEVNPISLVGSTTLPGTPPVEPVGVGGSEGSGAVGVGISPVEPKGTFSDREGNTPVDTDGWRMLSGKPPVDPGEGMMKGPRIVEPPVEEGSSVKGADGLGDTIDSGIPPVEATPEDATGREGSGAEVAGSEGSTIEDGIPPVVPTKGRSVG
jgi:hypothetical protein